MKYRVLVLFFILTALLSTAAAQRAFNGNNLHNGSLLNISGTITTLDGTPVRDARLEVRDLQSGTMVGSGYSLPNGSFTFSNLPKGSYEIRGTVGLEEARERVDIDSVDQQVTLQLSQAKPAPGGGATVSVAEMRVPDKARKEYEKGEQAFAKHKVDEAQSHCEKALAAAPTYSRALTLKALIDLTNNKLEDAAQDGERALKSDYGYGLAYVVLASVYNATQRYDDALRMLDRGMPLVPTSWQAHFEMAKSLLGKGEYQRSLASADRALQMTRQEYPPIHLVRAHALLGLKSYTEATIELEKYLGADPNGADTAAVRKTLDEVKAFTASAKK